VDLLSDCSHPPGCLGVNAILVGGKETEAVCREMALRRAAGVNALRKRFSRAKEEGDLPASTDPAALALFISTVTQGMSVYAASGASRAALRRDAVRASRSRIYSDLGKRELSKQPRQCTVPSSDQNDPP
jgi:hypothetical protein